MTTMHTSLMEKAHTKLKSSMDTVLQGKKQTFNMSLKIT